MTGDAARQHPLHEFHLALAGRPWVVLHAGMILTHADEQRYLRDTPRRAPYGIALWPAAIALAHDMAARGPDAFAGKRVLELGAGTGLPGLVAAALGASRVVQTDRDAPALALCERNARGNNIGAERIEHRLADWADWRDGARYDWIIGSDILYGDATHSLLRHIFAANLAPDGGRLLLSDPFRGASLRLLESPQEEGWSVSVTRWNLGDGEHNRGTGDDSRAVGVFELSAEPG